MSNAGDTRYITSLKDVVEYPMWKMEIDILFQAKDLQDHATGKSTFTGQKEPDDIKAWTIKDAEAKNYILATIHQTVKSHIMMCTTSKEMYSKLQTIFEKDSEQQKCLLLQEFYSYQYKSKSVLDNVSKIQNIACRLTSLKQNIDNTMVITKIMGILPSEFGHFSSAWDSMESKSKTVETLIARLQMEESKIKPLCSQEEKGSVCFKAETKPGSKANRICYKCGKRDHYQHECNPTHRNHQARHFSRRGSGRPTHNLLCRFCPHLNNHMEKDCRFGNRARNDNYNYRGRKRTWTNPRTQHTNEGGNEKRSKPNNNNQKVSFVTETSTKTKNVSTTKH